MTQAKRKRPVKNKQLGGCTGRGFMPGVARTREEKQKAVETRRRNQEITQATRDVLSEVDPKTGRTALEVIVRYWVRRAKQGDTKKGELLFAYGFGRPIQQNVNVNTNLGVEEWADKIRERLAQLKGQPSDGPSRVM